MIVSWQIVSLSLFLSLSRLSLFSFFRFGGKRENKTDAGEESMCEFFYARLSVHVFPIHRHLIEIRTE